MVIDTRYVLVGLCGVFLLYQLGDYVIHRPIEPPQGIIAPNEPVQDNVANGASFSFKGFTITPVADYEFEARLLAKEEYDWDSSAKLSPIDLGISWGKMSDTANLKDIEFNQSNRFLYYRYSNPLPIQIDELERSIANVHIIPSDDRVAKKIAKQRVGSVIHLRGKLVNVSGNNFRWNTSMTRTDTGKGACELMFVELVY